MVCGGTGEVSCPATRTHPAPVVAPAATCHPPAALEPDPECVELGGEPLQLRAGDAIFLLPLSRDASPGRARCGGLALMRRPGPEELCPIEGDG